jgi:nifR3 family TIM-barrel protein
MGRILAQLEDPSRLTSLLLAFFCSSTKFPSISANIIKCSAFTGVTGNIFMKHTKLLAHLKANPFVLAPMAAITDKPFRSFMREMGCGAVVSELVSATGLKYSSQKTLRLMEFEQTQHPVGIQLFGEDLEHLHEAAKVVEQLGADFVDLNFGCPVAKVVKRGAGSACLKDLPFLRDILRAVKNAVAIPVTIKVRTGWDEASRNTHEVAKIASDEGITWVAIHGRTRAGGYNGQADWNYIREVKASSPVAIIGNGDLISSTIANRRLQESGCDAVMIGRGCLKNPFLFLEANQEWSGSKSDFDRNFAIVFARLLQHLESFYDDKRLLIQIRKFASWFSAGFPGSSAFRKRLFSIQAKAELLSVINEYFAQAASLARLDTSEEDFLMGGHG